MTLSRIFGILSVACYWLVAANSFAQSNITITDVSVSEGNVGATTATFQVRLNPSSLLPVTVDFTTAGGTATQGNDFVAQSGRLTFLTGTTNQTISITINGDTANEPDESFFVNLSNPVNAAIQDNQGVGTILNDDSEPTLAINDVVILEGNSGTSQAVFTISLVGSSAQLITVDFATANGTATAGSDYVATNGVVDFPVGITQRTVSVTINGDIEDEGIETYFVNLSNPANAVIADSQGLGTIDSDDGLSLAVSDATIVEGNAGTSNAVFTVTLSGTSVFPVTVDYVTANNSASAGSDYVQTIGTLTYSMGDTSQQILVPVNGDLIDEANETFFLNLTNALNATISDAQGLGTITDDDAAPALSISDAQVVEGNSGGTNAVFQVFLSAVSGMPVTVDYATMNGSAAGGSDFTASSGVVTFPAGTTNQTFSISVMGDLIDETDEAFFVILSNPTNASLADAAGEGTIVDDDQTGIIISDVSVVEGNSGSTNAVFTVKLSTPSSQAVTVDYATADGTATAGADYTSSSGFVLFNPGETNKSLAIPVLGDTTDEPNENFLVNLSNPVNAILSDAQGRGEILDDDGAATLSITDVSVTEGNAGNRTSTFTVTLLPASTLPVTVNYATANGTAVAGSDYVSTNGTLVFSPGITVQTVNVSVAGDTLNEADETFFVNLTSPGNATIEDSQGVGTILNDDAAVAISISDASVTEGDAGTTNAVFTVRLSAVSGQTISVNYATEDISATAGSDYVSNSGVLTFTPGLTNQTITIVVNGDTLGELDETFRVSLSNPINATISDGEGIGTIVNDDAGAVLTINNVSVEESNTTTNAVFTVSLTSPSIDTVSVNFATSDGTAGAGDDYTASTGTLVFVPGVTNQSITIDIPGDSIPEFDEIFFVNLTSATNASIGDATGEGTIVNDDFGIAVSVGDVTVTEVDGGITNAVFQVVLSQASPQNISVDYATQNDTAIAPDDYIATSGTVNFSPGTTNQTITVPVQGDFISESTESFFVNLLNPINATIADGQGLGSIVDDDPGLELSITGSDSPDPVLVGCDVTYSLVVTNGGPESANNLRVTNTLPAGFNYLSATSSSGTISASDGVLVFDIGTLASGQSATMTIIANPTLDAVGLAINRARVSSSETDSNSANNEVILATTVENGLTTFSSSAVVLSGQTGLFEQTVTVTNSSCSVINALRVVVESLNGDVQVWNATGTNSMNEAFLQYNQGVSPGAVITFKIEYYSRTRTQPVPQLRAEIEDELTVNEPTGEPVAVNTTQILGDGSILVEFDSRPNRIYTIQYSEDLTTWRTAMPSVRATSNRTQWVDSGPPKTDRHPNEVTQRFYRIFRR